MNFLKSCDNKLKAATGLLHITTNLDKIIKSSELKPSAGGLGGVVYTVPIFTEGKLHNLGSYLINEEMPMFLKRQGREEKLKYIEIEPKDEIKLGHVDYLNWGKNYLNLCQNENFNIKNLSNSVAIEQKRIEEILQNDNIKQLSNLLLQSNVLKMIYFETVLEILFSCQIPNSNDELVNKSVKNLIYSKNPKMVGKFSLSNFSAKIDDWKEQIEPQKLIEKLRANMIKYLTDEENLAGHILFREFGFREKLEKQFADLLWAEAEREGINVLTYSIPKGEMGVLPIGKFNFYESKIQNGKSYKLRKLNLTIVKELVTKETILRNPYTDKGRLL